jgi:hypothetical protein
LRAPREFVDGESNIDIRLMSALRNRPNDLEGLTMDADGHLYAITSHSKDRKGRRQASREQLLRFRFVGDDLVDPQVFTDLIAQLERSPAVRQALSRYTDQPVDLSDINIEGLSFDQDQQQLLIGFREPLVDGEARLLAMSDDGSLKKGQPALYMLLDYEQFPTTPSPHQRGEQ